MKKYELELLMHAEKTLMAELTKYPTNSAKFDECWLRLATIETLLLKALKETLKKAA